jgi:2,4'-dihydroxyacetophenone dioxygenase
MNMPVGNTHLFDQSNVEWRTVEGVDHLWYYVCDVDEVNQSVDILFKFAANEKILLHRHKADYRTFVVQGELRIYRQNGELKEVRRVGSYVMSKAGGEPHREGGGDVDVIALFSNRNIKDGLIYEILDEDLNTVATFGMAEFKAFLELQKAA